MKSQVSFLLDKISPLQRAPHKAAGKGGKGGSNGSDGASHGLPLPGEEPVLSEAWDARRADGVDGEKGPKAEKRLSEQQIHDIAYEFQEATIETLAKRLLKIAKEYNAKTVAIAG